MDMDETKATAPGDGMNHLLERLLDEVESPPAEDSTPDGSPPPPAVQSSRAVSEDGLLDGLRDGAGAGGSPLAALLSNPALMSALPMLIENIGPLMGSLTGGSGNAPTSATRPHAVDRHTALLCAIKPYLSPQRREAAETVIRLCRVWDALERSGLSGLLAGLPAGLSESDRGERR
jgi:hypothetical protein